MGDRELSDKEAIVRVVRHINQAWLTKRYEQIGDVIADNSVIAPPGFEGRVHGRDAYVQSYRDYDAQATTHDFTPEDPQIDVLGDVAVATCPFRVVYEVAGSIYHEAGYDVLVLARREGQWFVVWRTMQSAPVSEDSG